MVRVSLGGEEGQVLKQEPHADSPPAESVEVNGVLITNVPAMHVKKVGGAATSKATCVCRQAL
jgi:hypothetical protein